MVMLRAARERLRLSLWFLPALFAVAAVVLALVLVSIDRGLSNDPGAATFLYGGTAEGARSILSTIAESMLTFTALVFTITMLVLQLASSQLSPRVMRTFLRDRGNQGVLGLFVATFIYTLLVLREVRAPEEGGSGFVPGLSIWLAFALLLASVGAFVYYINHMAHAIRASSVVVSIWEETVGALNRVFPDLVGPDAAASSPPTLTGPSPDRLLGSARAGVVVAVDDEKLLRIADHGKRQVELTIAVGDFVPEGAPLARLYGDWDDAAAAEVLEAVGLGEERTLDQDVGFGFRQLVDIGVRALSPGTNDPTTAVQVLDRIHDLLRRLAVRELPSSIQSGSGGAIQLTRRSPGWEDFVTLGLDEIRLAGENQIQINRRLRALLDDLLAMAPEYRQPILRQELSRLATGVERAFANPDDRASASSPSARGHAFATPERDR